MKKVLFGLGIMAVSGAASAGSAGALTLVSVATGSSNGSSFAVSVTGTSYTHTAGGAIVQLSATTTAAFDINPLPNNELFTHVWSGLTLSGSGGHSATSYACVEGTFGGTVGANLCANATFGGNFINETTVNYNTIPGVKTLGGDDVSIGPAQQMSDYGCTITTNTATTVVCQSAAWIASPGAAGTQLTFAHAVVPVPAAVWLFGSALGLLGWVRRRAQA